MWHFLVTNNTFSNNFKYLHGRKSQNGFESVTIKSFKEMVFPVRFSYFPSKNYREFEFFMIAREISLLDFFAIFC